MAHGRSCHPHAPPPHEPPHREENQADEAQDIRQGSQIESQEYGGHAGLPERLLCKERKSSTDEEQHDGTATNPTHPLEPAVPLSLSSHKTTIVIASLRTPNPGSLNFYARWPFAA